MAGRDPHSKAKRKTSASGGFVAIDPLLTSTIELRLALFLTLGRKHLIAEGGGPLVVFGLR